MRLVPLILIMLCAAAATAQESKIPTTPLPPTAGVEELFAALSSPDFETREQATCDLMIREELSDEQLSAALRKSSGESRQRLVRIAMHRFFARLSPTEVREEDTGSLGVDISSGNIVRPEQFPQLQHPAMLISATKPGFPAHVHLRPGDLVVGVDGAGFDENLDATDFSGMIQRFRAGQIMSLDVLRGSKQITVRIRLDSKRRLEDVYQIQLTSPTADPALYGPWQQHLATLLGDAPAEPRIELDAPKSPAAAPAAPATPQ